MNMNPSLPEHHEHLKCPRCDSGNTKFCYYNNYNLSQPRHFCKNCRRYWTKGGTLRNIPIGGGSRKITKRGSNSSKLAAPVTVPAPEKAEAAVVYRSDVAGGGGYSVGPFGSLLMEGSGFNLVRKTSEGDFRSGILGLKDDSNGDGNGNGETGCWNGGESGWPDLSMFTPGSSFR